MVEFGDPSGAPQIEIRQRAVGNNALVVLRAVLQQKRRHEQVHAAVCIFALVEDAVAAAQHRRLPEWPPRKAEPRRPLLLVRVRDRVRNARLAARLDQVFQVAIGHRRRWLRPQIDLVRLTGHDDRPRLGAVERAGLPAICRRPWRVLVPQSDIERQPGRQLDVILHVKMPGGVRAAEGVRWKSAAGAGGQTQHPVGKRIARASADAGFCVFCPLNVQLPM